MIVVIRGWAVLFKESILVMTSGKKTFFLYIPMMKTKRLIVFQDLELTPQKILKYEELCKVSFSNSSRG
jgi:hypothetical protein